MTKSHVSSRKCAYQKIYILSKKLYKVITFCKRFASQACCATKARQVSKFIRQKETRNYSDVATQASITEHHTIFIHARSCLTKGFGGCRADPCQAELALRARPQPPAAWATSSARTASAWPASPWKGRRASSTGPSRASTAGCAGPAPVIRSS